MSSKRVNKTKNKSKSKKIKRKEQKVIHKIESPSVLTPSVSLPYKNKITLKKSGIILIVLSIGLLALIFYPMILKEIAYFFVKPNPNIDVVTEKELSLYKSDNNSLDELLNKVKEEKVISPIDEDFSIIIPKLGINTKIIEDVDPYDSAIYQQALSKGIAHAKGTSLPDLEGNTFLFAHSSDNFYNANRFNSVFYLLHHLENDDIFYIVYKGEKYKYSVVGKKVVDPTDTKYMKNYSDIEQSVTLMTCWPAGTTINRLVVVAKLLPNEDTN